MKKLAFALLLLAFFANFIFAQKLISEKPIVTKKIYTKFEDVKDSINITVEQMNEDLDMFCYLLETAYIGYEDMLQKGFNIEEFKNYVNKQVKGQETCSVQKFCINLINGIKKFIQDSHFSIYNSDYAYFPSEKHFVAFSNTYVKKIDGKYIAQKGGTAKAGSVYTGKEENLFLYPAKGEDIYRVGLFVLEDEKVLKYPFSFNNEDVILPVKVEEPKDFNGETIFNSIESVDSGYASVSSFWVDPVASNAEKNKSLVQLNKFLQKSIEWQNKKNIIIDLRGNPGGTLYIPARFIISLYDSYESISASLEYEYEADNWIPFDFYVTYSPTTLNALLQYNINSGMNTYYIFKELEEMKEKPVRRIYKYDASLAEWTEPSFKGNIIFLVDKTTASASEFMIFETKEAFGDKVFVVGTNTSGCVEYVSIYSMFLYNSGLAVSFGFNKNVEIQDFFSEWKGETIGIFPDSWSSKEDLNETIYKITNDKKMKKLLKEKLLN